MRDYAWTVPEPDFTLTCTKCSKAYDIWSAMYVQSEGDKEDAHKWTSDHTFTVYIDCVCGEKLSVTRGRSIVLSDSANITA